MGARSRAGSPGGVARRQVAKVAGRGRREADVGPVRPQNAVEGGAEVALGPMWGL